MIYFIQDKSFNLHNTNDSARNRNGITCLCEGMPKNTKKDTCVLSSSLTVMCYMMHHIMEFQKSIYFHQLHLYFAPYPGIIASNFA
jgi:hypothetical protein